jgi:hypothetical protein
VTVQLAPTAPNATAYLLAWLAPLAADYPALTDPNLTYLGAKRWAAGFPLPYRMVNRITGADDAYTFDDKPVLSVHTFGPDYTTAAREHDRTHARIRVLIDDPQTDVVLPGGQIVNAEWAETVEIAGQVDYGDTKIQRFVNRYRFCLHFV